MDMVNQKVFRHKLNCERRSVIMALLTEMVSVKMLKLAVRKMVTNIKAGGEKNGRKNMNGCVMLN